jgi:hypothetical protein
MPDTTPREYTRAMAADSSEFDVSSRTVRATINTAGVDRLKTVIVPAGGDFEAYRRNPIVLCNHDGKRMPVGRNLSIDLVGARLVAVTEFLPPGLDDYADKVCELYRLKYLNAWSINFDPAPGTFGPPTGAEIRANPTWAYAKTIYREWSLLEYSVVTLPGNGDATRAAFARGLQLDGWAEPPPLPSLRPVARSLADVEAATMRQLRAAMAPDFARAYADAKELARGMV